MSQEFREYARTMYQTMQEGLRERKSLMQAEVMLRRTGPTTDTTRGEIVTRPAPATTGTSNSPASPDTPSQSASPAPEVTAPEPAKDPAEKDKKNGTQPPK